MVLARLGSVLLQPISARGLAGAGQRRGVFCRRSALVSFDRYCLAAVAFAIAWHHLHAYQKARLDDVHESGCRSARRRLKHRAIQNRARVRRVVWQTDRAGTPKPAAISAESILDFIFVVLAEESAFTARCSCCCLFLLILYGYMIALTCP